MSRDDQAFVERHARDWWLNQVSDHDVMARVYAHWYRLTYCADAFATIEMCPEHPEAFQRFKIEAGIK